ncbi:MAG: multicopper oxidase domain-containing protein [Thermomicrobiales bacterium]
MSDQRFRFTRREGLKLALLGAAATGAGLFLPSGPGTGLFASAAAAAPFQTPLPIPAVLTPTSTDATTDYYTITMQPGQRQILPGNPTPIWGYNGQFPGPTIKAQAGRTVKVHAVNALGENMVIHLHGGHTPASSDGHPRDTIAPGQARDYTFPNNQQAATLWYHDHVDMLTGKHVYMGLAGFYLVSDSVEQGLNLPSGQYDVPLLILDRLFNATTASRIPPWARRAGWGDGGMTGVQG